MIQPKKIRVLYFDESTSTIERFLDLCGGKDIIEIIGAFRSFPEIAPLFELDQYRFVELLDPDVIVLRINKTQESLIALLQKLKMNCGVMLVGLLSADCSRNHSMITCLDYYTEEARADGIMSDEDAYTHLLYQIKSARLARSAAKAGVKGKWAIFPPPKKPDARRKFDLITIGASTGGTDALSTILSALPAGLPPILVVQHMPENFSAFFAKNLSAKVHAKVVVAEDGAYLEDGTIYLAGDGKHLQIVKKETGAYFARCFTGERVSGHRPSVDVLFRSAAKAAKGAAVGVILTGMGSDGAQGLLEMHEAGAYTIGQDRETCAVYGMPMVAYAMGAVSKQLPLSSIARAIQTAVSQNRGDEKNT